MPRTHSTTPAFGLLAGIAAALAVCAMGSLGACATSSKAFVDDEAGIDGGGEGGPDDEGGTVDGGGGEGGGDSGGAGPRIQCGTSFCRSDEKCVSGACNFDCTGTRVPGDYATVTAAVTALAAAGNDITICMGAVQAGESVSIYDPGAHNKALKIIGTIPNIATLGSVSVSTGFSDVELKGFGTSSTMTVQGGAKVTLRALKLSTTSSYALQLRSAVAGTASSVVVDGCDIGGATASTYGIYVDNSVASTFNVQITNSYIHGGSYGVYVYGTNPMLQLGILNNTIDKTLYGLYFSTAPTAQVGYVNNIISNATQFGVYVGTGMTAVTHSNNALFGNVANYSGIAVEGMGYVKTDCMLDMTTTGVPQTKPGSACRGTGKDTGAPPVDYWNASRGSKVDIGAVQGP